MKFNKKWMLIISGCLIILIVSYFSYLKNFEPQLKQDIGMGGMIIEKKDYHIEPGKYMEMWFIGYNAYETKENRKRYKIYVEDAMTFNLLEEGKIYMVSAESFRKDKKYDYAYKLTQISNQEKYQLSGKGRIK